ncbi:MAG: hypothetical protein ACI8V2_002161 [Candidatus Latescibacterota bacterium]
MPGRTRKRKEEKKGGKERRKNPKAPTPGPFLKEWE